MGDDRYRPGEAQELKISILMVAGLLEVPERKENLRCGACNHPNCPTFQLPDGSRSRLPRELRRDSAAE